jgi:tetratricopeptide (TPR) repeat protein
MRRGIAVISVSLGVVFCVGTSVALQRGNVLYGDITLTAGEASPDQPHSLDLILYTESGYVVGRQSVPVNGRYRFGDVQNGFYDLVVESRGEELARMRIQVFEPRPTDVKRDIALQWNRAAREAAPGEVVYNRSPENKKRFESGLDLTTKENFGQAVKVLRELVESDPNDFAGWAALGTASLLKGDAGEAEKAYLSSLARRPDYLPALVNLGKLRLTGKNFEGAIEALTKAVETQPQSADAQYLLGEAYLQAKKGSKAVVHLNEAIRLDPKGKAEAHLRLAALYNAAQMKDRAAAEYRQFLEKRPDHPDRKKFEQYVRDYGKP